MPTRQTEKPEAGHSGERGKPQDGIIEPDSTLQTYKYGVPAKQVYKIR